MPNIKDIELHESRKDQVFGNLKIIEYIGKGVYKCVCECGNYTQSKYYNLQVGRTKSCGKCNKKEGAVKITNKPYKDISEQRFGNLVVKKYLGNGNWECKCDCDNTTVVLGRQLRCGNTKSCGCGRGKKQTDLKDKVFGDWKVVRYIGKSMWECECSCGEVRNVHAYSLTNGDSTSCGKAIHRYMDLKDQVFGELTAKEYKGIGVWKCECSCGNTVQVLGVNLRNKSTKSCGCKRLEIAKNTLMERYGDINPRRANSPRKNMDILLSKELMCEFLNNRDTKLHIDEASEQLDVCRTTILSYLKAYNLLDSVDIGYGNTSKVERTIKSIVEGYGYNVVCNSRSIVQGYELDIYVPEKNIAIEFNGAYWHSTLYKDKQYHQQKTIACAKQGIQLIHIFEHEWNDSSTQAKILSILNSVLNKDLTKLYARNTEVKHISNIACAEFLDKYHLQGSVNSSINLGCYYNNELIGVMTLGKPRFNANYEYEIHRMCWRNDIRVVGGSEKLFNYFIESYSPSSIITYSDISKFTGKSYTRLGFKPIQPKPITEPNYVWVKEHTFEVLSRYQTQKHKLIKMGIGTPEQTEDDIMNSIGYMKIYDSGNIKLEWVVDT